MKRTIDLMTAARAKGVELPGEWWSKRQSCPNCKSDNLRSVFASPAYRCRACGSKWLDKHLERNGSEFYIGPDLTLPENLHHAFRFADALFCQVDTYMENSKSDRLVPLSRAVCWHKDGKVFNRIAPERHLALVAACEAALGVGEGV